MTNNTSTPLPPMRKFNVYVVEYYTKWDDGWALAKLEFFDDPTPAVAVSKMTDWCEGKEHRRRARLYEAQVTAKKKGAKKK